MWNVIKENFMFGYRCFVLSRLAHVNKAFVHWPHTTRFWTTEHDVDSQEKWLCKLLKKDRETPRVSSNWGLRPTGLDPNVMGLGQTLPNPSEMMYFRSCIRVYHPRLSLQRVLFLPLFSVCCYTSQQTQFLGFTNMDVGVSKAWQTGKWPHNNTGRLSHT